VGRIDGGTASGVGGDGDGVPWHGEHVVGAAREGNEIEGSVRCGISRRQGGWGWRVGSHLPATVCAGEPQS
jgi:hypothetical protein